MSRAGKFTEAVNTIDDGCQRLWGEGELGVIALWCGVSFWVMKMF